MRPLDRRFDQGFESSPLARRIGVMFGLMQPALAAGEDPRLQTAMTLDMPLASVSVAPDGRKLLVVVRPGGSLGPQASTPSSGRWHDLRQFVIFR